MKEIMSNIKWYGCNHNSESQSGEVEIQMKLHYLFDYHAKRVKGTLYAKIINRNYKNFMTKYHELYIKGEFNLENKRHFLEDWFINSVGYFPNIENPKTSNEKIQWYKLYYHDPLITKCIDKILFKDHIKEVLGSEYAIPLLGVYSNANAIDFDALPNQFVIKANYGSDAREIILVTDKAKLDLEGTRKKISGWEKPWWRDAWGGYEFVQPKILIEEYIEQIDGQVYDYKFMCYNGEPNYIIFSTGRFKDQTLDFFDINWNVLDITSIAHPHSKNRIEQPKHLKQMVEISKTISKQFPLVRVDFFEAGDRLYVGELTFYPGGGLNKHDRIERDYELGEMIKLPLKSN